MVTRTRLHKALLFLLALAAVGLERHTLRLPYSDRFEKMHAEEWSAIGGAWSLKNGAVINRSDERGAKLVAGQEDWTDYKVHADLQVLGTAGDAGVLVRVQHATEGINGYDGYYAGIHLRDGALILGSSHDDWVAVPPVAIPDGIRPGVWYSLDVIAVGCTVGAHLRNTLTGAEAWTALTQQNCWASGKIGLRSVGLGAAWKNIRAVAASAHDLDPVLQHVPGVKEPALPTREDQFSATMLRYYGSNQALQQAVLQREIEALGEEASSPSPVRPIGTLRELNLHDRTRVRGVVSLLDPLYIQDETGGARIASPNAPAVNVGDEIEVVGTLQRGDSLQLQAEHLKVLSSKTPLLPVAISSTQAASGAFEGTYVELRGLLISSRSGKDGEYLLDMDDGTQRFQVVVPPDLNSQQFGAWSYGSQLRVRGVCAEPTSHMLGNATFALLASGGADVEVISGPSWSSGLRLYVLIALGLLVLAAGVGVYLKMERARLQAGFREREQIAMEIHDTLAQSFAGVSFNLQSMKKIMESDPGTTGALLLRVRKACSMAAEAHREASDRMGSLQRAAENEDILEQLKRSAQSMLNGTPITVVMESSGVPRRLAPTTVNALIRIGRELIANTLRHSRATELRLIARYAADRLSLSIEDNGEGFDPASETEGFGLHSVRVRARDIGAAVSIRSTPGNGTAVTIDAPYRDDQSIPARLLAVPRTYWRRYRGG